MTCFGNKEAVPTSSSCAVSRLRDPHPTTLLLLLNRKLLCDFARIFKFSS